MILNTCVNCRFHEIPDTGEEEKSRCGRENCWSEFSKCIAKRALDHYLEEDGAATRRSFSSLDQLYSLE
jgi:hypothetical protein